MSGIIKQLKNKLKTENWFPVTLTKAVYTEDNKRLDNIIGDTTKLPSPTSGICENVQTVSNNLTTLASKLIYGGNAKKIEVMSDATNLFQLRIWVSDTKAYVLVCNSNNINLKLYDNSTWSNIWSK